MTVTSNTLAARASHDPRHSASALRAAGLLFFAGFLIHNADHFRRGLDVLTPQVLLVGTLGGLVSLAAIALVLVNPDLQTARVAAAVGFTMAIGVTVVHLLPTWSAFSDSLLAGHVDAFTWVAVVSEIAGALVFGWQGARAWQR